MNRVKKFLATTLQSALEKEMGSLPMEYKGYTQGNVVILQKPLPVPDGTEVEILVPSESKPWSGKSRKQRSVAADTFNLIPSDPSTVRDILLEDLYET